MHMDSYCIWIVIVLKHNQISPIEFNLISPVEFNLISLDGSNQKRFAKSTHISTRFHPLNLTWFHRLNSTWFHWLDPTKNGLENLHIFQPDSPTEFNLISTIEFNLISPVGSNQKQFAKFTRISTRFLHWIQPDFKVACLLGLY